VAGKWVGWAAATVVACAGLLLLNAPTAAAQAPPDGEQPGLEPLWSEYPLNPDPAQAPLETSQRSERVRGGGSRVTPVVEPQPRDGGRTWTWTPGTVSIIAGALAGLTAFVVIVTVLVNRPALLEGSPVRAPGRRRREGGSNMADAFRWLRERGDPHREEADAAAARAAQPSTPQTRKVEPDPLERSTSVDRNTQPPPAAVPSVKPTLAGEREVPTAAQVGEHVTAVIASAQQAAEQIRKEATIEAERLRAEAQEEIKARIAAATREADKTRADAGVYSREARQAADAYAGEKRSEADSYAGSVRAEAEENARELRDAAAQDARQIEKDARRRREVLASEVERFEERLQSLHTVFQGITTQLEALLSPAPDGEGVDEPQEEEAPISRAEALTPGASGPRSA
jgi:hypothetical protein